MEVRSNFLYNKNMSSRSLEELKEPFRSSIKQMLAEAKKAGIPYLVTETTRTLEEQKENVRKGVSWTLNSKHLIGEAVDIAFKIDSKLSYDARLYNRLYTIAKGIDFVRWPYKDYNWGVDKPHFQYDSNKKSVIIDDMELKEAKETIRKLNTEIGRVTKERDEAQSALKVSQEKEKKFYDEWQNALDTYKGYKEKYEKCLTGEQGKLKAIWDILRG